MRDVAIYAISHPVPRLIDATLDYLNRVCFAVLPAPSIPSFYSSTALSSLRIDYPGQGLKAIIPCPVEDIHNGPPHG